MQTEKILFNLYMIGSGWHNSIIGSKLSCIAVCEIIDDPAGVKCQEKGEWHIYVRIIIENLTNTKLKAWVCDCKLLSHVLI